MDTDGTKVSALEIASMYFRSGADKVSIGSDAVTAAEEYYAAGKKLAGTTAIEQISRAYGNQAVVVSIDPKRVYVPKLDATRHNTIKTKFPGPKGEEYCWYACTINNISQSVPVPLRNTSSPPRGKIIHNEKIKG